MKINWWPWGVLTLVSLVLLSFFVLYPLAVLFSNSVVDDGGGYSLAAFFTLARDSEYVQAFKNQFAAALNQKSIREVTADLRAGHLNAGNGKGGSR